MKALWCILWALLGIAVAAGAAGAYMWIRKPFDPVQMLISLPPNSTGELKKIVSTSWPWPILEIEQSNGGRSGRLVTWSIAASGIADRLVASGASFAVVLEHPERWRTNLLATSKMTPASAERLKVAQANKSTAEAKIISIPEPELVWTAIATSTTLRGATVSEIFGLDLPLSIVSSVVDQTAPDTIHVDIQSRGGSEGSLVLRREPAGLSGSLNFGGRSLFLSPVTKTEHLVVEKSFASLPPEGRLGLPVGPLINGRFSSDPIDVKVLAFFLRGSARQYLQDIEAFADPDEQTVRKRAAFRLGEQFDKDNKALHGFGSFKLANVLFIDDDTNLAQLALHSVCAVDKRWRTPLGDEVRESIREQYADIALLFLPQLQAVETTGKKHRHELVAVNCRTAPPLVAHRDTSDYCGLSTGVGVKALEAVSVVRPDCIGTSSIHHELGHLLGAQHIAPDRPLPGNAFGYISPAPQSTQAVAPTMLMDLLGRTPDCKQGCCGRIVEYSQPRELKVEVQGNHYLPRDICPKQAPSYSTNWVAGTEKRNNFSTVIASLQVAAKLRDSWFCSEMPHFEPIRFSFNQPVVGSRLESLLPQLSSFLSGPSEESKIQDAEKQIKLYMSRCPNLRLQIDGHTDSAKGPYPKYNLRLSKLRAGLITFSLHLDTELGTKRLCRWNGFGDTRPFVPRGGPAADRRAEISLSAQSCIPPRLRDWPAVTEKIASR